MVAHDERPLTCSMQRTYLSHLRRLLTALPFIGSAVAGEASLPSLSAGAGNQAISKASVPANGNTAMCSRVKEYFHWFDARRDHLENPVIQDFRVTLCAQYQGAYLDPAGGGQRVRGCNDGNSRRGNLEWRRLYLGCSARLFDRFTFVNNWEIGGVNTRYRYTSGNWDAPSQHWMLFEFYLKSELGSRDTLYIGKIKPGYTGEYRLSSSAIETIERSALVNQLSAYMNYGIEWRHNAEPWKNCRSSGGAAPFTERFGWQTGVYLNGNDGPGSGQSRIEPVFNSSTGCFTALSLIYAADANNRFHLDWTHEFTDVTSPSPFRYQGMGAVDVLALTHTYTDGRFELMSEAMAGFNTIGLDQKRAEGGNNVFGLAFIPTYRIGERMQAVFRYQCSFGSNGVRSDPRYYGTNADYSPVSDALHGVYAGMNFFLCPSSPHQTKLMVGTEYIYSRGRDAVGDKGFTGWQYMAAVRASF